MSTDVERQIRELEDANMLGRPGRHDDVRAPDSRLANILAGKNLVPKCGVVNNRLPYINFS